MDPQETRNAGVRKLVAGYTGYAQQAALVNNWLNQVRGAGRRVRRDEMTWDGSNGEAQPKSFP